VAETEFKLQTVTTPEGRLALVTVDNGEDHTKPTVFGRSAFESGLRVVSELESGDWLALVITGKPFIFAAGADLNEFPRIQSREEAIAGSRAGHELFGRIRALPFPTLAAINGACLGGGVELALHCDYRTISSAVRHFAFPECFLGIFPAWGGTQLTPRLVGAETAVKFIVQNPMRQNKMLTAAEAVELGLADRILEPVEFLDDSIAFLLAQVRDGVRPRNEGETIDPQSTAEVVERARKQLDDSIHGAAPAPYRALDLIEGAAGWSIEEGYRNEEEALADLLFTPQTRASLYAYDLVERRQKRGLGIPVVEPRRVQKVGIVGAGLMARQVAALFLRRLEVPVVLKDVQQGIVDEALAFVREEQRGPRAEFLGSIATGSTTYDGFEDCDLVLEAVVEEMEVKQQVFGELRDIAPGAILASNTSSLSVAEMGAEVGMHFFNPVAVMPLVELVRTAETDDATLATAWDVTRKLRKRGALVQDAPGFVVNRVLTRMTSALMDALEHGNTVEETDEAVLRLGLPMAPSVLLQMVGPRVANHVLETMHEAYPDRFPLSPTLQAYANGRDEIVVVGDARRSVEEVTEYVLESLADEIRHLLEEGVVAEAADVDTCLLLGAGFPFFLGGITRHLDETGVSERVVGRPLAEVGAAAHAQ
jgi:3-hydroxyacyl-CoA dehydrogenase/enoyl-CoA hydratase/carnithine racemase